MGKYDDFGVPLTKREAVVALLIVSAALTAWIAIVSYAVYKLLQVA